MVQGLQLKLECNGPTDATALYIISALDVYSTSRAVHVTRIISAPREGAQNFVTKYIYIYLRAKLHLNSIVHIKTRARATTRSNNGHCIYIYISYNLNFPLICARQSGQSYCSFTQVGNCQRERERNFLARYTVCGER